MNIKLIKLGHGMNLNNGTYVYILYCQLDV